MSLSAASNMLKLLVDRHSGKRDKMADYLDGIAEEAANLVEHWRNRYEESVRSFEAICDEKQSNKKNLDIECGMLAQSFMYHSIMLYSKKFDEVFGKVKDDTLEEFRESLIKIVRARDIVKEIADDQKQFLHLPPDANDTEFVERFRNELVEMNRRAAALKVLAKTFRASSIKRKGKVRKETVKKKQ